MLLKSPLIIPIVPFMVLVVGARADLLRKDAKDGCRVCVSYIWCGNDTIDDDGSSLGNLMTAMTQETALRMMLIQAEAHSCDMAVAFLCLACLIALGVSRSAAQSLRALGQKTCRTKAPRIFRIFVPNIALNFAPELH